MNTNQYIQLEKEWLELAEKIMVHEIPISELSSIQVNKFRELVSRVLQAEYEFLKEEPETYRDLYEEYE